MRITALSLALAISAVASTAHARPAAAPSIVPPPGAAHVIRCINIKGETIVEFENDPSGPYYNTGTSGPITFLDKKDGKMTRIVCGTMIDKWDPSSGY